MLAVKPEIAEKETAFPYPFVKEMLPRAPASREYPACQDPTSSTAFAAPMAPPQEFQTQQPYASTRPKAHWHSSWNEESAKDEAIGSGNDVPMGSGYSAGAQRPHSPPSPRQINVCGSTIRPRLVHFEQFHVDWQNSHLVHCMSVWWICWKQFHSNSLFLIFSLYLLDLKLHSSRKILVRDCACTVARRSCGSFGFNQNSLRS